MLTYKIENQIIIKISDVAYEAGVAYNTARKYTNEFLEKYQANTK